MIAVNEDDMKYWKRMCGEHGIDPKPIKTANGMVFFSSQVLADLPNAEIVVEPLEATYAVPVSKFPPQPLPRQ